MGEFRVTDLMKSRSPKKPTPITQPSGPEPARKPRHVRTQLTHHSPLSPTPHPSTVEMGMRDYWDLGLRFRWFIFTWLLLGLSVGLYKGLKQKKSFYATAKVIFHNPVDDSDHADFRPFIIYAETIERLCQNEEILNNTHERFIQILESNPPDQLKNRPDYKLILEQFKSLEPEQLGSMLSLSSQGDNKDLITLQAQMTKNEFLAPSLVNSYSDSLLKYLLDFTVIEYERQLVELNVRIKDNNKDIKAIHSELKLLLDFEDGLTLNNNNRELSDKFESLKNEQTNLSLDLNDKNAQISNLAQVLHLNLEQQNIEDVVWINTNESNYVKLQNIKSQINELRTKYPEENPQLKQLRLDQSVIEKNLYPNKDRGTYYIVTDSTNSNIPLKLRELIYLRKNIESKISQIESSILKLVSQLKRSSEEQSDINKLNSRLDFLEKYRQKLHETQRKLIILKTATVTGYTLLEPAIDINLVKTQAWIITAGLGLMGGAAFGIFLAFIVYSFDNSPKYSVDLRRKFSIPVLGVLPFWKDSIYLDPQHPGSTQSELYSILRNNVRFCAPNDPEKLIFIFSPSQNDGKSLTAINLAVSFSLESEKVLLISADLRVANSLTELLPDPAVDIGICEVLADESLDFFSAVHPSKVEGLSVIPTLGKVNNPTKLLSSDRFPMLFEVMKQKFDVIIVDTPAILPVVDTASIIHLAQAIVMVINAGKTTYSEINEALKRCRHVNAQTHGLILNGIKELPLEKFYGAPYKNQTYDDAEKNA